MAQIIGIEEYLPIELRNRPRLTFFATVEFLALGAGAANTQAFNADADGAVMIVAASAVQTDAATDLVFAASRAVTIQLTSTAAGQQLSNARMHLDNIFGTAQLPCVWPFPLLLPANSSLQVNATNLTAAAINLRLAFHGMKILA